MGAPTGVYPVVKRVLDVLFAVVGLVALSPVLLLAAILIKCDSHGPVIFKQKRIGKNRRVFDMYKFRTMGTEAPSEVPTHEFSRSQDFVTTSGRVLRKSSIDELPQLWNILRGDMSFVGPRPALWNQYDLIEARERYGANSVTPGLTGWAQINGRDELSISKKAALDGHYVLAMGPLLDARCILGSVVTVVRADGVREGDGGRPAPSAQQLMPDGEAADPDSTVAGGRQQC